MDSVLRAIEKKKESTISEEIRKIKKDFEERKKRIHAVMTWIQEKVVEDCNDPTNITFSICLFQQNDYYHEDTVLNVLRILKKDAMKRILNRNENTKEFEAVYAQLCLDFAETILRLWNENQPSLLACLDNTDGNLYLTNV